MENERRKRIGDRAVMKGLEYLKGGEGGDVTLVGRCTSETELRGAGVWCRVSRCIRCRSVCSSRRPSYD